MKGLKKSEIFDDVIKNQMESQLEEMGFPSIDKADPKSKGVAFLKFYLEKIFSQFFEIDEEEIESGIVDKKYDLGIDFIHIMEDKIFIFQSKYGKSSVQKEILQHFVDLPKLIFNEAYIEKAHTELKPILKQIKKIKNPILQLQLITNQKIDNQTISLYENMQTEENVIYTILSYSQLKEEYSRAQSLDYLPPSEVFFNLGNEDYVELNNLEADFPAILITQKGTKLQQLFNTHKESLFNYNIRLWLGKNSVNRGMIDTIQNEPDKFFYYNNGVTAVCEDYSIIENKESLLKCKNFQIINGAQTVTTIAKQNTCNLSDVKVLIKIIWGEGGKKVKSFTGLNENIVRYSNSQTVINASDFRSNDLVQISIEKFANNLKFTNYSPFKDVFYKRKRRKELPKGNKVMSMQDLGKSYYSFKFNPHELHGNDKSLWDNSNRGSYYKVFGSNGEKVDMLPNERILEMFGINYIFEYIKDKSKKQNKEDAPSILFKYHMLWGIGKLLRKKYKENEIREILKLLVENGYYVNKTINEKKESAFSSYLERSARTLNYFIKSKKEQEEGFVIRNYQRSEKFTKDIELYIEEMIPPGELPDLI